MTITDSYKLMEIYAVCPKCGCDRIGGGKGTLECDTETGYFKRTCKCGWYVEIREGDMHMTHLEWVRSLPPELLAKLMPCPNERLRRENPIHCTRGTPAHTSCDECITKFLQTEVPTHAEA